MKAIKPETKVRVNHPKKQFTGIVKSSAVWENPFSFIKKEGVDYQIKNDDDGELYSVGDDHVFEI